VSGNGPADEILDMCPACSKRPLPVEGEMTKATAKASSAPGYCPSYGGSHSYEYLSSVTYTQNPGGTMTITVDIYIANPDGCIYGEPCPAYDDSPEYVNVWIDWNGDKDFYDSGEKVMDVALTGYLGINYHGTMTTSGIITVPPDAVNSTWMRVNLGWGYDPNDPCTEYWTWGNVVDKEVQVQVVEPPKIEEIIITPTNPETTKDVTLEAKITDASGYEIEHTSWTFDLPVGFILTGNPKTFEPAAGTHGNRIVECQIFYKNTATGETGMDSKTKEFELFFVKGQPHPNIADEDRDGDPNWFEYWRGALGSPPVNYKPGVNWGSASIATGAVSIGDNAGFGPDPRHAKIGIDCYYGVMTHELQHRSDIRYTIGKYGSVSTVPAANDTDGDRLPNEIDPFPNTVNGAGYPEYAGSWVGDWEYKARQVENVTASNSLDWANPGKQSNGVNNPHSYASQSIAYNNGGFWYLDQTGGVQAEFTGNYYDYGIDTDGDGLYDYLILEVEVNVTAAGNYTLIGGLEGADYTLWTVSSGYLGVGVQTIVLNFDGLEIRQHREDGPYPISLTIESGFSLEHVFSTYNTSAYSYADFERQATEFTCTYSDYGTDTDGDGLYNYLTAELSVNITTAGDYTLEGWLYDKNGTAMMMANNSTYLDIGDQLVLFSFDGLTLRRYRVDGPYNLKYLKLYDENDTQIDFIYDAYNTSAYNYTDFQSPTTSFRDTYSDYGLDTNGDGFFEYLTVEIGLNVTTAGNYTTHGGLHDCYGNETTIGIYNLTYLNAGNQTVTLNFDGSFIYKHGVNGSFNLTNLLLYDGNGTLIDNSYYAYTTSAYNYTDFQPLIRLTGNYSDYGTDTDSNGLFDNLTVEVRVMLANEGYCVVTARLVDSIGEEIIWASNTSWLSANQSQTIQLNFDGISINKHGVDGPYHLRDVYAYHTGDPTQPDYIFDAYITDAYNYTDFESLRGDLNSDGILTPADALICLQIAVGSRPCDAATLAAADVSGDNRVTSLDALMILQAASGAITL
jgi:hypothetical protein